MPDGRPRDTARAPRAVASTDGVTDRSHRADMARGIGRVTSKPPGTIEWE